MEVGAKPSVEANCLAPIGDLIEQNATTTDPRSDARDYPNRAGRRLDRRWWVGTLAMMQTPPPGQQLDRRCESREDSRRAGVQPAVVREGALLDTGRPDG